MTADNLQLLEARQEEAYITAALLQVAQAVVTSNDLNDTLDTIVHLLPILVGIETCAIYLWDATNQLFRPTQVSGQSRRIPGSIRLRNRKKDQRVMLASCAHGDGFLARRAHRAEFRRGRTSSATIPLAFIGRISRRPLPRWPRGCIATTSAQRPTASSMCLTGPGCS